MHTNLKLINPLKENELFSVHKYQKMAFSNFSSNSYFNTVYRPFNTQKYSFTTLNKNKKFSSTLTNINKKSKTNYNQKKSLLSNIPYPSFPNNNRIPAIYKNSNNKKTKYPKILNNNFTVYNFHNKNTNDPNIKHILLTNTYEKFKRNNNIQNRTYGGDIKFLNFNQMFNNKKKSENNKNYRNKIINYEKEKIKKSEKKPKIKINTFNNTLFNNVMRLIEIRDQNNNSIIYTKVTNLLLDEINKLIELQRIAKEKNLKDKGTMTYKKIKLKKRRRLRLGDEDDISILKIKNKQRRSLQIKSIDLKCQEKYGFNLKAGDSSLFSEGKTELSDLSDSFGGGNMYNNFYKNKKYKNEYGQTVESVFRNNKNNFVNDDIKRNYITNKNANKNISNDSNNIKKTEDKKHNVNNFINLNNNDNNDNIKKGNSIFNNFIKDSLKKNENRPKRAHKEKSDSSNTDKIDFSNILSNIASNIEKKSSNINKEEDSIKKEDISDNKLPVFERMVQNEKLVRLIQQYMEISKIEECEDSEEEKGKNNKVKEEEAIENEERKKEKIKMITEYYKENLVKNKKIKRKNRKARTFILPKIELGLEIIKHICDEIEINKNDKDIIVNCLFNVMEIARKNNKEQKEEELQNKILKPVDEIIKKYLENMKNINLSNQKPNSMFNQPLKSFLRDKLKEILNIADEYNKEEKKEEVEEKKKPQKSKKLKESQKSKKQKKLIFDNSYFFKNGGKSRRGSIKLDKSIHKEEDEVSKDNLNASFSSFGHQGNKRNINIKKSSKFVKKIRPKRGLKSLALSLNEEKEENIKNNNNNNNIQEIQDMDKLKHEDMLDKRLQAFFEQIRQLKNINLKNSRDEEKLRLFIDKEIEKFDYSQEKKIEARKYNFFNELKISRINLKKGKYLFNKKLLFHSPLNFNTLKNIDI